MSNKYKKGDKEYYRMLVVLFFIVIGLVISATFINNRLLKNTHEYGQMLVKNYAEEEELNVLNFQRQMGLAAFNLMELKNNNASEIKLQKWFTLYRNKVSYIVGNRIINFIGVVDGKTYSAVDAGNVNLQTYEGREWYERALEADGRVIFTGVYTDEITGQIITTVAKKLRNSNDVISMDLAVNRNTYENNVSNMVKSASFFIFDRDNTLFYYHTPEKINDKTANQFGNRIIAYQEKYGKTNPNRIFYDERNIRCAMYVTKISDGSRVFMIVPINDIMEGEKNVVLGIIFAVGIMLFCIIAMSLNRNLKQKKDIVSAEQTIGLLGDIYYAIYRMNFREGTYECIKTTPDIQAKLGERGDYKYLLDVLGRVSMFSVNQAYVDALLKEKDEMMDTDDKVRTYFGGEFKRRFEDGYKWVNVRVITGGLLSQNESFWCFRVVDEEKKKELENTRILKESLMNEEEKSKRKNEFFSKASHDMRTPLNAIMGFSELALSHQEDAPILLDYIKKMRKSANQLLLLVDDILEYSRVGVEMSRLNIEEFNLQEVMDEIEISFKERAYNLGKELTITMNIEDENILGDQFKIIQVLNNLISNSLKYSNRGDKIKVDVKEFEIGQHPKFQFIIQDSGIGMSDEFLKHVFEPYSREVQTLSKTETIGSGLGMVIVKNLIQKMNGEITVESAIGVGTKVTVTLPLDVAECEKVEEVQVDDTKEKTPEEIEAEFFAGKRILVAEDNELNMEILTELLKMRNVEVSKAWNGKEALDIFLEKEAGYFDCILMDMHMPVMDGCQAAEAIRNSEKDDCKIVPIFAVTANAFAEDIDKTTACGMNGHVPKPLDFKVLYKLMRKYMDEN